MSMLNKTGWVSGAIVMTTAAALAASAPVLVMLPNVEARGPQVLLRDLVQNHDSLPADWGSRAVMAAPEPGKSKRVSISTIAYALQQYPDMNAVTLRGTAQTTVRRASAALEAARLAQAVEEYVASQPEWRGAPVQVVFDNLNRVEGLPAGRLGLHIDRHTLQPGKDGTVIFEITVTCDDLPARQLQVAAKVFVLREVWVAARVLGRGQLIAAEDLTCQSLPWHPGSPIILAEEDIIGQEISRTVQPGQPIYRHLLLEPVCANAGDMLNVIAQNGGLEVKLQARALSAGRRGDRIMCMNETSRRRLLVRLIAPRTAVLEIATLSRKD